MLTPGHLPAERETVYLIIRWRASGKQGVSGAERDKRDPLVDESTPTTCPNSPWLEGQRGAGHAPKGEQVFQKRGAGLSEKCKLRGQALVEWRRPQTD